MSSAGVYPGSLAVIKSTEVSTRLVSVVFLWDFFATFCVVCLYILCFNIVVLVTSITTLSSFLYEYVGWFYLDIENFTD